MVIEYEWHGKFTNLIFDFGMQHIVHAFSHPHTHSNSQLGTKNIPFSFSTFVKKFCSIFLNNILQLNWITLIDILNIFDNFGYNAKGSFIFALYFIFNIILLIFGNFLNFILHGRCLSFINLVVHTGWITNTKCVIQFLDGLSPHTWYG
jgi:hypothetical protein